MSGLLTFQERYRDEESCILALADRRWPSGFACARCGHRRGYRHKARARVFECAACGRQESVTAGTIFHRTRTPLPKWFLAAWLMGRDKRGVSALFLARELGLRYETAWLMAHKLRHGLAERPDALLDGMVEVDESYYGGRGKPESRGRGMANANKSLLVLAVEKVGGAGQGGEGQRLRRRPGAACHPAPGQCRELGGFVRAAVTPGARLLTDDFKGYAGLGAVYQHQPTVQGQGKNAETQMPIIHVLFSNLKTWLTAPTFSAKHLPRYGREAYRFNRRRLDDLGDFVLSRAMARPTITYRQLIHGLQPQGARDRIGMLMIAEQR